MAIIIGFMVSPEACIMLSAVIPVHVAAAIRGGASLVHGVQMQNAEKKLGVE